MPKYKKNPLIAAKTIDQEQILLNTETGDYFGINQVGADIWELIDGENDLTGIMNKLLETYDVERHVLELDVTEFLKALIDRKIIVEG